MNPISEHNNQFLTGLRHPQLLDPPSRCPQCKKKAWEQTEPPGKKPKYQCITCHWPNTNPKMTQKEIFLENFQKKLDAGLIGIHITPNPEGVKFSNEEEAYAELNRMAAAPDCPDPEVLGKHTL